jgi:DNA-binding transcriptional MerR regulator
MPMSESAIFNLKVVMKETGIKADVLRAWERRYGLPKPQRTEGGHRLYSQRDIETIKWLIARQNEGMSISHAVELWMEMTANSRDPLIEARRQDGVVPVAMATGLRQPTLETLRNEWVDGCLAFNEVTADQALNQAFAFHPVETVCVELLQSGLVQIGALWYRNRATVQQEHFASGLAMRRLDTLMAACPAPTRSQTILLGCPPGESHTLTALLLALFLRRRGLRVVNLGADVPRARFEDTVNAVQADMVVLVAQQLITAASLQQVAAGLSALQIKVGFGGRIFSVQPELVRRIAGYFLGNNLEGAVGGIDLLLAVPPGAPQPVLPSAEYVEAVQAFLSRRVFIDAQMDEKASTGKVPLDYLYTANQFLGDNITAALRLGDMAYLDAEISWLHELLRHQLMPGGLVRYYLEMYTEVVRHQLGGHARPVVHWLERQIETSENL